MSLLDHTADMFKSRDTPLKRWFKDGEGRYAFRVDLNGRRLYVAAQRQAHADDTTSAMKKLVDRAADSGGLVALRIGDEVRVFDPSAFGAEGTITPERRERGETFLRVPVDWGVPLDDWVDGRGDPETDYGDLRDYL